MRTSKATPTALSQSHAAKLLGVAQPNVSNLARGHYEDFSIDRLLRFLKALDSEVRLVVEPTEEDARRLRARRDESQGVGAEFSTEEAKVVAFHEEKCRASATLWRDGLSLMLRGFDPMQGHTIQKEDETVLIALLMRARQTMYRAYDSTLKGYYPQALSLLRAPIEDWIAYWYVRSFPEEHERFCNSSLQAPTFNDMLQKLESKHFNGQQNRLVRAWIKRLHKYSHADGAGISMVVVPSDEKVRLLLGPDQNRGAFEYCASEGVVLVLQHLSALDNLRQLFGQEGISELEAIQERVERFYQSLIT